MTNEAQNPNDEVGMRVVLPLARNAYKGEIKRGLGRPETALLSMVDPAR